MKAKKWIKAIAALGAGISMVGATILGAMAADLSAYPAPFVKNGVFDGVIVVGDNAAAEDVVGAVDIGASLQYAMRQEISLGEGMITISEGKKIEKTGDKLNYGDDMQDVIEVLDDEDLPVILADGRYQDQEGETKNDERYTQTLRLFNETGTLLFANNDDGNKAAGDYLFFDDHIGRYAYEYRLEFDSPVDYTTGTGDNSPAADMEDTVLKIQGNDYTITDVKWDSLYKINKMTLLAGETIIWLQQGKTLTRTVAGTQHEIEVTDVNDAENMCGVSVDGDVVWIKRGQVQTINGVSVGVTDAVAVHAQLQDTDICKINVGATEIVLNDGSEVEVNGKDVDGSKAVLNGTNPGELDYIQISWVPDDEEYLADGSSLADPVLGNFEFKFAGVTKETEEISLTTSSDEAMLTFVNNDGKDVEIPYYWNTTSLSMGTDYSLADCDGRLLLEGDNCDSTGTDSGAIEGTMFLLLTSGNEAHVMQVADISNDNKMDLKDLTYGKTYEDKDVVNGLSTISLGSLGTIQLTMDFAGGSITATDVNMEPRNCLDYRHTGDVNADGIVDLEDVNLVAAMIAGTIADSLCADMNDDGIIDLVDSTAVTGLINTVVPQTMKADTKYGASLTIKNEWDATTKKSQVAQLFEEDGYGVWGMSISYNILDDELNVVEPVVTVNPVDRWYTNPDIYFSRDNKDDRYFATEWGTLGLYDSEDHNDLVIQYPDEQTYGNVFVAPIGATVGKGEGIVVTLNPMYSGSARLASEVAGKEKELNMILVGGPCANEAAKVIMNASDEKCTDGFTAGKAIIKMYQNGDRVAMLVAGYSARDTRKATAVVSDYSLYSGKLTGTEVEVSGTSLSDVTVSAPK